ncbi:unnamed protein product [Mycena citricolor]|uniref:ER membrane protein complex subunit 7 beta-sandwich domain-containing protein n=1 Tax=Mycena citricolor TaxID=2018698 RepID=A0AAD2HQ44_9AGAR|nr:unnamed protein product [Mycena citricolor]
MKFYALILAAVSLWSAVFAADVSGRLQFNEAWPDLKSLGSAQVILDSGSHKANVLRDGSFTIPDVPVGTYILSVVSRDFLFDNLRIDIPDGSSVEIRPYSPGTPLNPPSTILLPQISLSPRAKLEYYVPPQSFNLVGMFQNPMMLMLVFGGLMVFAMPYLTKNLDPETMKEFREQQARVSSMQSAMASGDLKAGLSALVSEDAPKAQPAPAQAGGGKSRSGKKARR